METLKTIIGLIFGIVIFAALIATLFMFKESLLPSTQKCLDSQSISLLTNFASTINENSYDSEGRYLIKLKSPECIIFGVSSAGVTGNIPMPTKGIGSFGDKSENSFLCLCEYDQKINSCNENTYCAKIMNIQGITIIFNGKEVIHKKQEGFTNVNFLKFSGDHKLLIYDYDSLKKVEEKEEVVEFKEEQFPQEVEEQLPQESEPQIPEEQPQESKEEIVKNENNLYFPVTEDSLGRISYNWGNVRDGGARCHAGVDLYTKGESKVIAIKEGKVVNIYSFYQCSGGSVQAIIINHGDFVVNYGEVDTGEVAVNIGDSVKAGQYLGKATRCGMLHLELYQPGTTSNKWWYPNSFLTESRANICAKEQMDKKPKELLNPMAFIDGIKQGKIILKETL